MMRTILALLMLASTAFARPTVTVYGTEAELNEIWEDVETLPDLRYGVDWESHISTKGTRIEWVGRSGSTRYYKKWPGAKWVLKQVEETTGENVQCPAPRRGGGLFIGGFDNTPPFSNRQPATPWQPPVRYPTPPLDAPPTPQDPRLDDALDGIGDALEKVGGLERRLAGFEAVIEAMDREVAPEEPEDDTRALLRELLEAVTRLVEAPAVSPVATPVPTPLEQPQAATQTQLAEQLATTIEQQRADTAGATEAMQRVFAEPVEPVGQEFPWMPVGGAVLGATAGVAYSATNGRKLKAQADGKGK